MTNLWHSAYSESVGWVAWPIGEASRAEPKFSLWFLWGNGNKLWGLRAKFWRGPSYHAKRCLQGYQHVILSSIVHLRAFLWHKTVLPPTRGSIRCIIAEKHWQCHFSRKPEVEIWRKHAQSTFRTRFPIRILYQITIRGSIGTLSALSNVSKAGLGKFRTKRTKCCFCVFPIFHRPLQKK